MIKTIEKNNNRSGDDDGRGSTRSESAEVVAAAAERVLEGFAAGRGPAMARALPFAAHRSVGLADLAAALQEPSAGGLFGLRPAVAAVRVSASASPSKV
jgi:hypothetical protein